MKEQPIETKEHVIGHSIGQRPIHTTYEPPGPASTVSSTPEIKPSATQNGSKETDTAVNNCESGAKTLL